MTLALEGGMVIPRVPRSIGPVLRGPRVRSPLLGLFCLALAVNLPAPAAAEVSVHPAGEVLAEWTVSSGDALFFRSPAGDVWEFVDDIEDASILNKGDGEFFPLDPELVKDAVASIAYSIDALDVEIFVLPYPRRGLFPSNADERHIYLSPGVAPLSLDQVHALVVHEMGHIVHRQLLPDENVRGWATYRRIRGIEDTSIYHAGAIHRDRPHEIFAEDFRYLFGGAHANYAGSIENPDLKLPGSVPGLRTLMLSLSGTVGIMTDFPVSRRLRIYPNPTREGVHIGFATQNVSSSGLPLSVNVYDVRGRLVTQEVVPTGSGYYWGGRTSDGAQASPGLYFVEVLGTRERWVGKVLVAR